MSQTQKNIVFFLTDQQHFRTLQANSCPEAQTPNLDRLAREGMNFQHHYVANPVCSPSRGAIWTGRLPSANGLYANGCTLPASETTLPQVLEPHGYATGHFGKLHLEPTLTHGLGHIDFGFGTCEIGEGDQFTLHDDYNLWLRQQNPAGFQRYYYQMGLEGHQKAYTANLPEEFSHNSWVTIRSIDWMKRQAAARQPFFLSMGYFDPHHAWNPCEPYASRFAGVTCSEPKYDENDVPAKPGHYYLNSDTRDPAYMQRISRAYHAMVAHLDDCLGRLLKALEEARILEDTIIVFSSDHGEFLGNHGMLFKGPYLCDDLLRVPLIVWDGAGRSRVSGQVETMTSALDFFATFCALAGMNDIPETHGRPFLDADLNLSPGGEREHVVSEWRAFPFGEGRTGDITSMRTRNERYVRYANTGEEEYYRHDEDPYELRNLAADPGTAKRRSELAAELEQVIAEPNPTLQAPAAPW